MVPKHATGYNAEQTIALPMRILRTFEDDMYTSYIHILSICQINTICTYLTYISKQDAFAAYLAFLGI